VIQGYPNRVSVVPGGTLVLHVSADAASFRLVVYRQGPTLQHWHDFGTRATTTVGFEPRGAASQDFGWDAYNFGVPGAWPSGVYVGMLREVAGGGETLPDKGEGVSDGAFGKVLFVVLPAELDAPILYKLPLLTYHAYNQEGGWSLYQASPVTLRRPGGGTGGTPWDAGPLPDGYDGSSARQTFAHWDARFIAWLEGQGYQVHYCTDLDLHEDLYLNLLAPHALLLSSGHDEYWTAAMRDHAETFVSRGGNIGFFTGNTAWWQVSLLDATTFERSANWSDPAGPNRPEDLLTGVSYRNAGGWWAGARPATGFEVQRASHWVFEGMGLADGAVFGAAERLVGYECDGADFDRQDPLPRPPRVHPWTPAGLTILGIGDLDGWQPGSSGEALGNRAATMVLHGRVGSVFNAATTDWPRVLGSGAMPQVDRITANVVDRLGGTRRGSGIVDTLGALVAMDGFYSSDDGYRHAVVATAGGDILEIYFHPAHGSGRRLLANLSGTVDVSGFYSDDDGVRHVIVARSNGEISDIAFTPQSQTIVPLGLFPGVISVAGFYSSDDQVRHAIVLTDAGTISEIYFHPLWPAPGKGVLQLDVIPGTVDIAAFYSPDDQARHAVAGVVDGSVHEIYFNPQWGIGKAQIGTVTDLRRVSAFYADNDGYFDRRVLVSTLSGPLHEIKFSPRAGLVRATLGYGGGVTDVGGFFSSDDGFRHAMLSLTDGSVVELYYER
jgi:hypothetical protein